ncbi:hypothetical protein CK510_17035 [Brunnivagina elsteri CCALA 953]|uniref:Uncharacterized protein n=2 Tax=Brunnivagina TaxID=3344733 RepID=A0A2A2TGK9_9CYAN|nr:hypothetical protein CK510_17035 [Calothrix elsteri CCALA 953]
MLGMNIYQNSFKNMLIPAIFVIALWVVFVLCLIPLFSKHRFYFHIPAISFPTAPKPRYKPRRTKTTKRNKPQAPNIYKGVKQETRSHLLKLVGNDIETASRLVDYSVQRNPGREMQWHWEKAVWDLERDRY